MFSESHYIVSSFNRRCGGSGRLLATRFHRQRFRLQFFIFSPKFPLIYRPLLRDATHSLNISVAKTSQNLKRTLKNGEKGETVAKNERKEGSRRGSLSRSDARATRATKNLGDWKELFCPPVLSVQPGHGGPTTVWVLAVWIPRN